MSKGNYSESEKPSTAAAPPPAAAPVPPPPPPAASLESVLASEGASAGSGGEGGMSAALAQIAEGGVKLKKVAREDRKRKPESSLVPGDSKPVKEEKASKEAVAKGDPVCKLEDKKWTVRFQENRQDNPVTVDITAFAQSVAVANCNKSVIVIKGKCTSIAVMNCTNVGVIFDDVVASVEVVRSKKVQLQLNGAVPQIALDNSSSIDVYVQSAAGKHVEIVTSLCEGVNASFPGETADSDPVEYPIPMQFVSHLKGPKLITAPSSHV